MSEINGIGNRIRRAWDALRGRSTEYSLGQGEILVDGKRIVFNNCKLDVGLGFYGMRFERNEGVMLNACILEYAVFEDSGTLRGDGNLIQRAVFRDVKGVMFTRDMADAIRRCADYYNDPPNSTLAYDAADGIETLLGGQNKHIIAEQRPSL